MSVQLTFKCNESWDKMPKSTTGKYCGVCAKNIYDLTGKSEEEIRQLYLENNGKLCGRIRNTQLMQPYVKQYRQQLARFCLALYLTFGGLLFTGVVKAQDASQKTIEYHKLGEVAVDVNHANENNFVVKGKVIDAHTKEAIFSASVAIYSGDSLLAYSVTDEKGFYQVQVPAEKVNSETYTMQVTYLGYMKKRIVGLELKKEEPTVVDIAMEYEILMGDVFVPMPNEAPLINKDPDAHRSKEIGGDEIRRSPYR